MILFWFAITFVVCFTASAVVTLHALDRRRRLNRPDYAAIERMERELDMLPREEPTPLGISDAPGAVMRYLPAVMYADQKAVLDKYAPADWTLQYYKELQETIRFQPLDDDKLL